MIITVCTTWSLLLFLAVLADHRRGRAALAGISLAVWNLSQSTTSATHFPRAQYPTSGASSWSLLAVRALGMCHWRSGAQTLAASTTSWGACFRMKSHWPWWSPSHSTGVSFPCSIWPNCWQYDLMRYLPALFGHWPIWINCIPLQLHCYGVHCTKELYTGYVCARKMNMEFRMISWGCGMHDISYGRCMCLQTLKLSIARRASVLKWRLETVAWSVHWQTACCAEPSWRRPPAVKPPWMLHQMARWMLCRSLSSPSQSCTRKSWSFAPQPS